MSGELTVGDVTVTVDQIGREVLVLPDAVVARLRAEIRDGWREIPDVNDGYSRPFPPGSWVHRTTMTLLAAYTASLIPVELAGRRRGQAQRDRQAAAEYGCLSWSIVARSGWDAARRWWTEPDDPGWHVPGCPHRRDNGDVQYRG